MTPQGRHARYITAAVDGGIRQTRQRAAGHLAISDAERGGLKLLENTDMKRNPRRAVRPQSLCECTFPHGGKQATTKTTLIPGVLTSALVKSRNLQ